MHNHNPTDTYDHLTGGEKESMISGQAADNGNKQDKEVASTTDNASTLTSLPQPNATGSQQIAGNLLKVFTPPQREQKARLHLQHTSSEYPPPAVFTEIDISAVVGPMGNGKSTHLMTLTKFLATENYRVIALKHAFDTRCAPDKIGTHDHQLLSGSSISSLPTSITNTSQRTFFLIDEI
jgi:ABC-type multidrug transport system fused ATPase/permease subunit